MSINRVNICGNLTRDAEVRALQGQQDRMVINFGVAVNERVPDGNGGWTDRANFVDCALFCTQKRADYLGQRMRKGVKVAVEGRLRYHSWTDQQTGQNRSKLDVTATEVELFIPPQQQQQQGYAPQPQQAPQVAQQPAYAPQPQQQAYQPQQPAYAPNQGYQQPQTAYPQAAPQPVPQPQPMQQQMPMTQQAPAQDVYDEDIPF